MRDANVKQVLLAEAAIARKCTRGQFIRENTTSTSSVADHQVWSNAYSYAMMKNMPNLWDVKQMKADYIQTAKNAYYYLLDNYSCDFASPERSAATLIRISIRKIEPNFIG